jgi:hypothetical protein
MVLMLRRLLYSGSLSLLPGKDITMLDFVATWKARLILCADNDTSTREDPQPMPETTIKLDHLMCLHCSTPYKLEACMTPRVEREEPESWQPSRGSADTLDLEEASRSSWCHRLHS